MNFSTHFVRSKNKKGMRGLTSFESIWGHRTFDESAARVDGVQRLVLNLIQDACSSKLLHSVAISSSQLLNDCYSFSFL
jgi:hypothetical protein